MPYFCGSRSSVNGSHGLPRSCEAHTDRHAVVVAGRKRCEPHLALRGQTWQRNRKITKDSGRAQSPVWELAHGSSSTHMGRAPCANTPRRNPRETDPGRVRGAEPCVMTPDHSPPGIEVHSERDWDWFWSVRRSASASLWSPSDEPVHWEWKIQERGAGTPGDDASSMLKGRRPMGSHHDHKTDAPSPYNTARRPGQSGAENEHRSGPNPRSSHATGPNPPYEPQDPEGIAAEKHWTDRSRPARDEGAKHVASGTIQIIDLKQVEHRGGRRDSMRTGIGPKSSAAGVRHGGHSALDGRGGRARSTRDASTSPRQRYELSCWSRKSSASA